MSRRMLYPLGQVTILSYNIMKFSCFIIKSSDVPKGYDDAMLEFETLLANELKNRFHSDMVEDWSMSMICVSQERREDIKPTRVKYYADRILTNNASVTPKLHVYKLLDMNFYVDFDKYVNTSSCEERMKVLAQEFMQCIETMTYPVVLRKTFDRKAFEQCVRNILTEHGLL